MKALGIVKKKFPQLVCVGCATHTGDLLNEDVGSIPEFAELVKQSLDIAKFIKGCKYVLKAFKRLIGKDGRMVAIYPLTRFSYAALTMDRVANNSAPIQTLVSENAWKATTTQGMKPAQRTKFEGMVAAYPWTKTILALNGVFTPMSLTTHFLETRGVRSSMVNRCFAALRVDFTNFKDDDRVKSNFKPKTLKDLINAYDTRYRAGGRLRTALKCDAHTIASILDPYTTPVFVGYEWLPTDWETQCKRFLKDYYSGDELEAAMDELKQILLRRGAWGDHINSCQDRIQPPATMSFESNAAKTVWMYKKAMTMTHPVDDWELTGRGMYPKLFPIAVRLLSLAVQSADVERVCKAHKVIHTKARNRLLTKTVQMLLYTYCNLRLLDASPELGDFLVDAMKGSVDDDEPELAAGPTEDTDDDDDDESVYDEEVDGPGTGDGTVL